MEILARDNPSGRRALTVGTVVLLLSAMFSTVHANAATTWVVDGSAPACNDAGAGTASEPFCKISKAVPRAAPGDVVLVHPAIYREQVDAPSGAPGQPIIFRASGPGVQIVGSRDLSASNQWTSAGGTRWSTPYIPPSAQPQMLFLDGTRLTKAVDLPSMALNEWFYDATARLVYIDLGGASPSDGHQVEIGALSYAFQLAGRNSVIVEGFEMLRQNSFGANIAPSAIGTPSVGIAVRDSIVQDSGSYGINVDGTQSGGIEILRNEIRSSGSHGIRLRNSSEIDVIGNNSHDNLLSGIAVHGSSDNQIANNVSAFNAKPGVRVANGIDINSATINGVPVGSSNNVIRNNTLFSNQDSGIQVYNGSHSNLIVRNISYQNGDHGFDAFKSTGTRFISNTSVQNFKDGYSIEGLATGTTLRNNIGVDNGLTTGEYDLFVDDDGSIEGFTSDYDILWKSGLGSVIRANGIRYDNLSSFASATGQEGHGIGANPRFADAGVGDLRPLAGSPAIDSADAATPGFQLEDQTGFAPVDDPSVPNTGSGSPLFSDRGALEFRAPSDSPPNAVLGVAPRSGVAPLVVTASGQGSTDTDFTPIASYTFDFGDGSVVGPQVATDAAHTYTRFGTFTVTMTVTDTAGLSSAATTTVTVADAPPKVAVTLSPSGGRAPLTVRADASASTDNDGTPIVGYVFRWGDGSAPLATSNPIQTHKYTRVGKHTFTLTATDSAGLSSSFTTQINVNKPKS
ncbi:MAG: PKD domain-containing protein [Actinomycetota bacterium]|nr:PKD domain-containing protein [Actinomycetota bacterium]